MPSSSLAIVVVAAGRGSRAGEGVPKQYRTLAGEPIITHALRALHRGAPHARILVTIHPDDEALYEASVALLDAPVHAALLAPVPGGASRQASVLAGLEALAVDAPALVLIHDCARPFASPGLIARAIAAASATGTAVPGLPVTDTIKQIDALGRIEATPPRAQLRAVQTPQAFRYDLILNAHRLAASIGQIELTDDGAVAECAGHPVHVFEGDPANMKVTNPEDFAAAEARLLGHLLDIRTGQGFDVHAFTEGDQVWLGGVSIPHSKGLLGHSDADVLMHAVTDAIYGALADGDIGAHFPPSDPQWKGAPSDIFLRHAAQRVRERGGMIAHVDGTVICEAPKVGPHRDAIRAKLAEIMGVDVSRVAVKATTSEQLGFTGRREGVAAMALATVRLPA
jgi:2-C-methyl-D-erythritol 4-phosphate cytidylyltransferase/2-C-methyl-D-erythritol 2,4-cyclodiphosphate synthase